MAIALRCWKILPIAVLALALNAWQVAPVYRDHQPAAGAGSPTLSIAHLNLQSSKGDIPALVGWLDRAPGRHRGGARHPAGPGHDRLPGGQRLLDDLPDGDRDHDQQEEQEDDASPSRPAARRSWCSPTSTASPPTSPPPPDLPDLVGRAPRHRSATSSVTLLGLHTQSPTTPERHALRDVQLDAVTLVAGATAPQPAVAFGDFNVTYYSPMLKDLLDDTGARSSQLGFGMQATWPVQFRPAGIGDRPVDLHRRPDRGPATAGPELRVGAPGADRHLRAGRLTPTGRVTRPSAIGVLRPQHGRVQDRGRAAPVELRRSAALAAGGLTRRFDERGVPVTFRWKLRGSSVGAPHRLVDLSQLVDRELGGAERGGERGVLELGPSPLHAVGQDAVMVERQPAGRADQPVDAHPAHRGGIGAGDGVGRRRARVRGRPRRRPDHAGSRCGCP